MIQLSCPRFTNTLKKVIRFSIQSIKQFDELYNIDAPLYPFNFSNVRLWSAQFIRQLVLCQTTSFTSSHKLCSEFSILL